MKPMVSIIVPIYNNEKYVEKCIESVINQDYTRWQLLLIDDGSTDHSGSIAERLAADDERLQVFHLRNGGVSRARNYGLARAEAPYIMFLDSDDELYPGALKVMIGNIKSEDDWLIACYVREYDDGRGSRTSLLSDEKLALLSGNIGKDYWSLESLLAVPVVKLYRTDIIKKNKIFFPVDMVTAEDQWFNYDYLHYVKKYTYLPVEVYKYKIRNAKESLSKVVTEQAFASELKNLQKKSFLLAAYNSPRRGEILNRYVCAVFVRFMPDKYEWNDLKKRAKELIPFVCMEKIFPINKRKIICLFLVLRLYFLIYWCFKLKRYLYANFMGKRILK